MVDLYFCTNSTDVIKNIVVAIWEYNFISTVISLNYFNEGFMFITKNSINANRFLEIEAQ
jgi:hypothetical protein